MKSPVNCFFLFCNENRANIALSNPNLSNSSVSSLLGKMWRNLDSQTKLEYKQRAKELNSVSTVL